MRPYIHILIAFLSIVSISHAQQTYIPDDNFEQALIDLGYDSGPLDDFVPTENINSIASLSVSFKDISDLTGIEDFAMLESLNCSLNLIDNLNVSQNTNLVELICYGNQLMDLDLSQNLNLTVLTCYGNLLTSLDISQNTMLSSLTCNFNEITSLDTSTNTALVTLNMGGNNVSSLDLSTNILLERLECSLNQLTNLDVSLNTNLIELYFPYNMLISIDTSQNTTLGYLDFNNNLFTTIDLSQNPNLLALRCYDNLMTSLDLSVQTGLEALNCSNNALSSLDVSQNTALLSFRCNDNQLTELNIKNGNNTAISSSNFYATANPNLTCIEVDNVDYSNTNWLNIDAQTVFSTNCSDEPQTYIPDDNFEQALIDLGYDSALDDFVLTENINTITNLDVRSLNIESLTGIGDFTNLDQLICRDNLLTSIDISQNLALTDLQCGQNQLTNLDVSENVLLRNISCLSNQLTSLDISQNIVLTNLRCYNNLITSLDTSQNTDLIQFSCYNNLLTSLDVSQNPDLLGFVCSSNQLTSLDMRNGNNTSLNQFISTNNPNLNCIDVDDTAYSEANWTSIDSQTVFSEDCSALSVSNFEVENNISIYPNPTSHIVNIKTPNNVSIDRIEIMNLSGKRIQIIKTKTYVDVSSLFSGIYLLKITINRNETIKKLIVY